MCNANPDYLAAIDLGSNSFHLALIRHDADGSLHRLLATSEKVQLAAGLNADNVLDAASMQRALACLNRFVERLKQAGCHRKRVVATSTLRVASNADDFKHKVEQLLGCPVDIISGEEEARLINIGVGQALPQADQQRLVVDIGGGSTELIIGQHLSAKKVVSLQMGCVNFTRQFFNDGLLNQTNVDAAYHAARLKLDAVAADYKAIGWQLTVGASGTIKALVRAHRRGMDETITPANIDQLIQRLLQTPRLDQLHIPGVKRNRSAIFPAGLAILKAVMDSLDVDHIAYVDGALREGVIHEMLCDTDGEPALMARAQD